MGNTFDHISSDLKSWFAAQHLFFVGTAPLTGDGFLNVSPKGPMDTFAVTGPNQVAYLDYVGSSAETAAHLQENGRICVMFCSFADRPQIVRLHGTGRVFWAPSPEFDEHFDQAGFTPLAVTQMHRAIIVVDVVRVAQACGFGVPMMDFVAERDNAVKWARGKIRDNPDGLEEYKAVKNVTSLDGLPAWPR